MCRHGHSLLSALLVNQPRAPKPPLHPSTPQPALPSTASHSHSHAHARAAKSQAPCILFLDELDALAPSRQHSNSEHERQATARLLAAVDELRRSRCRVGLVGATNRRSAVDSALRRAGRLDSEVRSVLSCVMCELGCLGREWSEEVVWSLKWRAWAGVWVTVGLTSPALPASGLLKSELPAL